MTFQQDPRIHALDGECVCGAKSCALCFPPTVKDIEEIARAEAEAVERELRIRIWNELREAGVGQDDAIRRVNRELETLKAEARATLEWEEAWDTALNNESKPVENGHVATD